MKLKMSTIAVIGAVALGGFPHSGSANLLVQPGFESNNLAPLATIVSPVFTPGIWGYEIATNITAGLQGELPRTGTWMHAMRPAGSYTQTLQFLPIAPAPSYRAAAWFNSDAPAAIASIVVSYWALANSWPTSISQYSQSLTLDSALGTWETIDFVSAMPLGATWLSIQVAYNSASITHVNGVGLPCRGYVDDALVEAVPEPAGLLTLAAGVVPFGVMILKRRRG